MESKWMGFARLMRPPNLPTAAGDILAGSGIALWVAYPDTSAIIWPWSSMLILVFASMFLYASGVVLNDVFDLEIDSEERPERPIPSGLISVNEATAFGAGLMFLGIALSFMVNYLSGGIAFLLALSILVYDKIAKKDVFFGPLNMGLCRGLNLLLGMSVLGSLAIWWICCLPLVYIFAITLISRGEVHGKNRGNIILSGLLYAVVVFFVFYIANLYRLKLMELIPFLILFVSMTMLPLIRAYRINKPENIRSAVKFGIISIVVLDACLATIFISWSYGLMILLLLPFSLFLSRLFAST